MGLSSGIIALNNQLLDAAAILIHNDVSFVLLTVLLVLATERNPQKLRKILFACILVIISAFAIKNMLKIERPCTNERFRALCDASYSFPSIHTAISFTVATAFLLKRTYPLYALFGIFVAFTRLYLGVHSFDDVAGGLVVGVVGYYITDLIMEKPVQQRIVLSREKARQYFHIVLGLLLLILLLLGGRFVFLFSLFLILIIGSFVVNLYSLGMMKEIDLFKERFEREGVKVMGLGSALYILGMLGTAAVLQDQNEIAATILLLAMGDGAATLFGLNGKYALPWNRKKTLEGSVAFFFFGLSSCLFVGARAIPLALLAALVESLPLAVDDNILIPLIVSVFFLVI
jgi:dolichol kinase